MGLIKPVSASTPLTDEAPLLAAHVSRHLLRYLIIIRNDYKLENKPESQTPILDESHTVRFFYFVTWTCVKELYSTRIRKRRNIGLVLKSAIPHMYTYVGAPPGTQLCRTEG